MATYNFDSFKSGITENKRFIYSDLHLDMQQDWITAPGIGRGAIGKDIILDYDLAAILNSLTNLFTTLPGQRPLIPEYGMNLLQYVFIPVSKEYGDLIGNEILRAIRKWEPRVSVQQINVNALTDQNEYDITISIYLPALKKYTGLIGKLNEKEFAPIDY